MFINCLFFSSCGSNHEVISDRTCHDFIHVEWKLYKKIEPFGIISKKEEHIVFRLGENYLQYKEYKLKYSFEDDCNKLNFSFEDKNISFRFYQKSKDTIKLVNRILQHESLVMCLVRVKRE